MICSPIWMAHPSSFWEEAKDFAKKEDEIESLNDLDLTPGALDKSNDSVRVYLREMGMVPLLTREGEIELAMRIERGETAVRKALSRSRLVIQTIIETKSLLQRGAFNILDVLQAADPQGDRRRARYNGAIANAIFRGNQ